MRRRDFITLLGGAARPRQAMQVIDATLEGPWGGPCFCCDARHRHSGALQVYVKREIEPSIGEVSNANPGEMP
jgi:hypothetical protein